MYRNIFLSMISVSKEINISLWFLNKKKNISPTCSAFFVRPHLSPLHLLLWQISLSPKSLCWVLSWMKKALWKGSTLKNIKFYALGVPSIQCFDKSASTQKVFVGCHLGWKKKAFGNGSKLKKIRWNILHFKGSSNFFSDKPSWMKKA